MDQLLEPKPEFALHHNFQNLLRSSQSSPLCQASLSFCESSRAKRFLKKLVQHQRKSPRRQSKPRAPASVHQKDGRPSELSLCWSAAKFFAKQNDFGLCDKGFNWRCDLARGNKSRHWCCREGLTVQTTGLGDPSQTFRRIRAPGFQIENSEGLPQLKARRLSS